MDSGDDRYSTASEGRDWTLIPGPASALIDSPEAFQVYLEEKLEYMHRYFVGDERLLFVNAWNEWAEGTHLEPDRKFGHVVAPDRPDRG